MVTLPKNQMVKDAIRSLWNDSMTIMIKQSATNPITKITKQIDNVLVTDEPCRISYKDGNAVSDGKQAIQTQIIKLFCREDLDIPAGSTIIITRDGKTQKYKRSGISAKYTYHQEIYLELADHYA